MTPPMIYVVDASVAVKLYLAELLSNEAHALFACLADPTTVFHVPDLFFAECANIFWKHMQRGNATDVEAASHLASLAAIPLMRTSTFDLFNDALTIALRHGITAYDSCYLALAQRHGIPTICADDKLVKKMAGSPHQVIGLASWRPPAPGSALRSSSAVRSNLWRLYDDQSRLTTGDILMASPATAASDRNPHH